jgi:hypothetical protein
MRIVLAAALEAFREEVDLSRSVRLSSTLPRRTTIGQSGRTYRDPAVVVDDEDTVLSQGDPPLCVKKQVPSVRDMAVQVD